MASTFNFNGHQVRDVHEGVRAVISHYVNPVIGRIRLRDADGESYPHADVEEAFSKAATDILNALEELIDD